MYVLHYIYIYKRLEMYVVYKFVMYGWFKNIEQKNHELTIKRIFSMLRVQIIYVKYLC